MNSFTKALQNAVDKITGTSRINNETNPASALNMARRKALTKPTPMQTANAGRVGKGY